MYSEELAWIPLDRKKDDKEQDKKEEKENKK